MQAMHRESEVEIIAKPYFEPETIRCDPRSQASTANLSAPKSNQTGKRPTIIRANDAGTSWKGNLPNASINRVARAGPRHAPSSGSDSIDSPHPLPNHP